MYRKINRYMSLIKNIYPDMTIHFEKKTKELYIVSDTKVDVTEFDSIKSIEIFLRDLYHELNSFLNNYDLVAAS